MPNAKSTALLGLVESDGEDSDILIGNTSIVTKISGAMAPAKKARATTTQAAKQAQHTTTRTSGKTAAAKTASRTALSEKPKNVQEKPAQGRGKKRAAADDVPSTGNDGHDESLPDADARPKGTRGRPRAAKAPRISEEEDKSAVHQPQLAIEPAAKRGRKPKSKADISTIEPEIPETQQAEPEIPETQPVDALELSIEEDDQIEDLPSHSRTILSSVQRSSVQRAQPHVMFSASRRTAPASDSELYDPSMRRRIGDLTRKYENLEVKYRDLREIGIKEAERNYDQLKKHGEERLNTANQLIATLKSQLSTQTELAKESQRLKQQLEASQNKVEQLQSKMTETDASLSEAKTEIKTLSTKLATARSADTVSAKIPSSAVKGSTANNRIVANAEAAVQVAQMKEDLYGDLTGLLLRGVKSEQSGEIYDCIQTGRNGSRFPWNYAKRRTDVDFLALHFKLAVGLDDGPEKFDEPQFLYMPQLDPSRDQDLIDILPDYLVEEITFPQSQAARFYSRVMKSLNERPE
ncbi:chromosome segregation protein Csm1/Pcs1-domain-containing protein [Xylariaceae sp. FL0662B]|nr:chromosome segregation protein Csm1/Pcs1-domain-containing protein [Xylariaceae sp. FL0662B]